LGRLSRNKGASYERWCANKFREVYPGARRGIGQARNGGDVPDVEGVGAYWVQTKHEKNPHVFNALHQASEDLQRRAIQSHAPSPYSTPLVIARRNQRIPGGGAPSVVAMYLQDFIKLVAELEQLRKGAK
jgi:hypothetical protein